MLDYRMDTFLSLCETQSYTKTAEHLHLTQPSVPSTSSTWSISTSVRCSTMTENVWK